MLKYGMITTGILINMFAQIAIKKASSFDFKHPRFILLIGIAGLLYVLSFGLYVVILKQVALSEASPIMTIGTMILVILASFLIFQETISTKQIIGIAFGIASIALVIK
jgi:drug/metabolite transporter (DMT)-like permease